jgi:ammonium transporter, Amt family
MNSGSTAWLLISTALVLLMTPGLAFFYGGLVRAANVINTIKMSFIALGVVALEWTLVGYSLAFAPGTSLLGGGEWLGLSGVGVEPVAAYAPEVPHLAFMAFQMMFAVITPALISGAVVGRMKFRAYIAFALAWAVVVYNPVAHWVWGVGGWVRELGALDFAGGTVVHVTAGVSALVAALILGPRRREPGKKHHERPHNIPMVVLGASLLWFGWFGFNAGSALSANGIAALAVVTTMLGGAAAVVTWIAIELTRVGRPTATGASIGAVVGLVAITPGAGFVTPLSAILIGAIASACSYGAVVLIKRHTKLDDALDVFACHGIGGVVGSLLTGVFATRAINPAGADGLIAGNPGLVGVQAIGVLAAGLYAAAATAGILVVVRRTVGLRVACTTIATGLDAVEHAERAYAWDTGAFPTRRDTPNAQRASASGAPT